jgi:hypothetical protein
MDGKELRDRAGVAARALHDDPLFTHLALPAYLETSNPKNLAWYRRFGFEIERELRVGAAKPAIWTMRRPARG